MEGHRLARVYFHAWQVTDDKFFRTITEQILDYVVREMLDPEGGFYSTQDADGEGEEGKFFVWTPKEIREVLGSDADEFMAAYGVTRQGNFEGKNILEFVGDMEQRPALADARGKLLEARETRVHPGRDEKVLTSWNGLMMAAFGEAARALGRDDYRETAERNTDFVVAAITEYIAARLGVSAELMRSTSGLMGSHPLHLALRFLLEAYCLDRHRMLAAIS